MAELGCDAVHPLIPELALGLLDGRERAEVLVHIEHCPACQHELLLMGDVADRLVELTPRAEPPAGFETGVMAVLRSARPEPPPRLTSPRPQGRRKAGRSGEGERTGSGRWRRTVTALVAAAVTASVGVGGWALGHHGARTSPPAVASAGGKALVAELLRDQKPVGQIVITSHPYPWMSMTVSAPGGDRRLTCEVGEKDGTWVRVGSFEVSNGAGYWASGLPYTSSPITAYRVVDDAGHTVAVAKLPKKP